MCTDCHTAKISKTENCSSKGKTFRFLTLYSCSVGWYSPYCVLVFYRNKASTWTLMRQYNRVGITETHIICFI